MVVYAPKLTNPGQPSIGTAEQILNSGGDTSGFNAATWDQLKAIEAANNAAAAAAGSGATPAATPAATGPSAEDLYWQQRSAYEAAQRTAQQDATAAAVQSMFESYGLGSMYSTILDLARKDYGADAILLHLRQTPEYKARFPAMDALNKKGRAISEADYINYEKTAASLEQRYGLPEGMLMGNVTNLLTNEVSAAEMNDRVKIAVADSLQAPDDLKNTLRDYYGLDPETALSAYYLDPNVAVPLLEKQSASARIGVWADRTGVSGVGRDLAEELQGFGVTEDVAQRGFGQTAQQKSLTQGRGDTATQRELIGANLQGIAGNQQTAERAAAARVNRFGGGGQFGENRGGLAGLGSSST
jgi:hypothetical protein